MNWSRDTNGFTLLEMIITIVILGILGLFTFSYVGNLIQTYTMSEKQRRIYSEATYAIERISRELRDAQVRYAGGSTLEVMLYHTKDGNGTSRVDPNPYVRYRLDNQTLRLYRDSGQTAAYGTTKILADYVTAFTLSTSSASPASPIYTVGITVAKDGQSETFATKVCPKNYSPASDGACVFAGRDFGGCYEDVVYQ